MCGEFFHSRKKLREHIDQTSQNNQFEDGRSRKKKEWLKKKEKEQKNQLEAKIAKKEKKGENLVG
jgi:hypothetical protein